jgi:hypothetical protein
MKVTKELLLACVIVLILAGGALGAGKKTESMINPAQMAKLGLHQMPDGMWMGVDPQTQPQPKQTQPHQQQTQPQHNMDDMGGMDMGGMEGMDH